MHREFIGKKLPTYPPVWISEDRRESRCRTAVVAVVVVVTVADSVVVAVDVVAVAGN